MGPEYNELMDNMAFRVGLNVSFFALWVVVALTLLRLA
jgi:hypothetical protein